MNPALSIITINFNNSTGLLKTIESVVNQSFIELEFIIIDGNSMDNSVEVIKKFENKTTFWISERDFGIYNAMNKGIKKAKGEFLLFLNSGDYLVNQHVISEIFSIENKPDIILGNLITKDGYVIKLDFNINFANIWKYGAHHQAMFIKKSLFEDIGLYNDSGDITSDWQFLMLALFKYKKKYKYIDKVVSVYDMHGISADSENRIKMDNEKLIFMKEHFSNYSITILKFTIILQKNYDRFCSIPRRINKILSRLYSAKR
jgi:glycosyltransferase involved in cell wall biosynthesis